MDDLYNNLKVYEARIKGQSSLSSNSHNVAFVSSENTRSVNETVNAAHDIPAAGSKEQPSASRYADDVAMITMRVKRFLKKTGRNLNFNGKEPVGFDKTRVECYNFHRRGYFARECHAPSNQGNMSGDNERRIVPVETPTSTLVVQDGLGGYDWSYQAEEGPTDFALIAHSSDSANSSNFKTGLGYDSQLSENEMPKCKIFEAASDRSVSEIDEDNNQAKDRYKVGIGYHAVPPPYTGNYMPPRADLSFARLDDYVFKFKKSETRTSNKMVEKSMVNNKGKGTGQREVRPVWNNSRRVNHQNFSKMTHLHPKRNFVPTAVATKSGQVLVNAAKQTLAASTSTARPKVNTAAIRPNVNAKSSYFKPHFPKRRHFNQRSAAKTNTFSRKINTAKGKNVTAAGPKVVVNATEGKKENVVKHMTGNKSFLIEYQEIDGGFVAFGGSPKGGIENQLNHMVKIIRCNNGTKFKNSEMNQFCQMKGIKREFSVARTPQQNGVAKRKNRTLIEAARTMLADSPLPTTFWAEAVNTACYVQNRVLATKPHNKTPYELLIGRSPNLEFMRPFGCLVTILNTLDHLGKFDGKADEGFLVGYFINSKAFRVFNSKTRKVEENLQVNFLENKPNVAGDVNTSDIQCDVDEISRNDDVSTGIFDGAFDDRDMGAEANTYNLDSSTVFSPIPTTRLHCFLSQMEPKKVIQALKDPSWIEAMQEELLQFKLQDVSTLVDLPYGKRAIGSKWVFINKLDEREEEVYVYQPPEFKDPGFPDKVYKVKKALYGLHRALRAWPDIMFVVCACARHQVSPKVSHLHAVKRIFRYLMGQPKLGLWYPKDSPFELEAYIDNDYAGSSLDRKSTTGGCQFLGCRLISRQCKKQIVVANSKTEVDKLSFACVGFQTTPQMVINLPCLTDKKELVSPGQTATGKDFSNPLMDAYTYYCQLKVNAARSKLTTAMVYAVEKKPTKSEGFEQIIHFLNGSSVKYALTVDDEVRIQALVDGKRVNIKESSIRHTLRLDDAEVDTQSIPIPTKPSSSKPQKKHKPKRKHTKEPKVPPIEPQAKYTVPLPSYNPLPSGKDSLKLQELMDLCTNLSNKVLDLESEVVDTKSTYKANIKKLENRVERLEEENMVLKELKSVHSKVDSDEPVMEMEKSSKQGRKIADIDADVKINLEKAQDDVTASSVEVSKPRKRKGVIIQDPGEIKTTITMQPKVQAKDKGKAILIEEPKPLKRQAQIKLDEEVARQLEAELNANVDWNAVIEQVQREKN
uniref:Retrovirus-related Pol polyprotein from transposon TNT 1-94 n=1 Tax=Tanacetum cinerariifolium TaxID=118510 RepID=A0A699HLZ8_TANCI|nr:retrovirus-related Pol polyprotein from transposon TNT 1-94 [Tanacetum cinerariifolium]